MLYVNLELDDCVRRTDWTMMSYILYKSKEIDDYFSTAQSLFDHNSTRDGYEFFLDEVIDAILHKFKDTQKPRLLNFLKSLFFLQDEFIFWIT
jgi:hypothetical protein